MDENGISWTSAPSYVSFVRSWLHARRPGQRTLLLPYSVLAFRSQSGALFPFDRSVLVSVKYLKRFPLKKVCSFTGCQSKTPAHSGNADPTNEFPSSSSKHPEAHTLHSHKQVHLELAVKALGIRGSWIQSQFLHR
jgi:hypothetical protein